MVAQRKTEEQSTGIRPLDPARDLGQLADLIENAFGEELSEGGGRVLQEIRFLSMLGPLSYLFVATGSELDGLLTGFVWEEHGRVIGNVTVGRLSEHTQRWQISNVAVWDSFRRQGIGLKLVEAAIDLVRRNGGRTAYLFVREDNQPALELYSGLGFTEVDRTTELRLDPLPARPEFLETRLLLPLDAAQGHSLYELVRRASGPGYHWLHTVRRSRYVLSADERLFRWARSFLMGETELRWGVPGDSDLQAAAILSVTRMWNRGPHRLKLWVHPNSRGHVEQALAWDIVSLLSRQARRPTFVSLPACEALAASALLEQGFRKLRTLVLMRQDL